MKLTLIGGGGVRSPLFVMTLLRWQKRIGLTELCLMDIDERKLALFSTLCRELVQRAGNPFSLTATTDARLALSGADHVVTTIRAGFEQGRATDERIALRHGVLGQEGVPPGEDPEIVDWYTEMFKHKETRRTFTPTSLVRYFAKNGFQDVQTVRYKMRRFNINNWLVNSGLRKTTQTLILNMHRDAPDKVKAAYGMAFENGVCYIDTENLIVVGAKP